MRQSTVLAMLMVVACMAESLAVFTTAPEPGNRTLIVFDRISDRNSYTQLLLDLEREPHGY